MKKALFAALLAAVTLSGACTAVKQETRDMAKPGCSIEMDTLPGCSQCEHKSPSAECTIDCPYGRDAEKCARCSRGCETGNNGPDFMEKHRNAIEGQKQHIHEKLGITTGCDNANTYGKDCSEGASAKHAAMMAEMTSKHIAQVRADAAHANPHGALTRGSSDIRTLHDRLAEPGTQHVIDMYHRRSGELYGMGRADESMAVVIANAGTAALSEDQKEKVTAVQNDLTRKKIRLNADMRIAELDALEAISARKPNMKRSGEALKKLGALKAAFDQELLKAFGRIRAILTDEQFDAVRKSILSSRTGIPRQQ